LAFDELPAGAPVADELVAVKFVVGTLPPMELFTGRLLNDWFNVGEELLPPAKLFPPETLYPAGGTADSVPLGRNKPGVVPLAFTLDEDAVDDAVLGDAAATDGLDKDGSTIRIGFWGALVDAVFWPAVADAGVMFAEFCPAGAQWVAGVTALPEETVLLEVAVLPGGGPANVGVPEVGGGAKVGVPYCGAAATCG
jgi:hypothetical protein